MNCRANLKRFYDKQGLTGQHRRRAVQYDMRALRKAGADLQAGLWSALVWGATPQGIGYWGARATA